MGAFYWLFWTLFGLFFTAVFYACNVGDWSWLALVACWMIAGRIIKNKERIEKDDD